MDKSILINKIFHNMKIEYYAVLSYSDVKQVRPYLIKKQGFTPRSVIVFLLPYYAGRAVNLSKYACAMDYHIAVNMFTNKLAEGLSKAFPDSHSIGFGDHSPIDERHAAASASLGILGDNGLLINEKYGSYVFIAEVITDIPPEHLGAAAPMPIKHCISCAGCKKACPTGALCKADAPCLSALTQKKGSLTPDEFMLISENNTAWGCDVCQDVCPYNQAPVITPLEFFKENRIEKLTDKYIRSLSDSDFLKRAFAWRGRDTVLRNLEILGNKQ